MEGDQTQTEQTVVPTSNEQTEPTTNTTNEPATTQEPAQETSTQQEPVQEEQVKQEEEAPVKEEEAVKEEQQEPVKQQEEEPVKEEEAVKPTEEEPVKEQEREPVKQEEAPKEEEPAKPVEAPEEEKPVAQEEKEQPVKEEVKEEAPVAEPVVDEKTQKHVKAIDGATKLFMELRPVEKWDFYGESNGLKTYTRLDVASGLKMARGDGVIMRPVETILKPVLDTEAVKKWAGNLQSHQIVEEGEYIIYRSLNSKVMFVTQRETVVATKVVKLEDGSTLVVQRSTEHPDWPEVKDFVRASVQLFAWLLTPDKEVENKTYVTSIIFVDPKGWVPIPIFNAFINDQAQSVKKLKDFVEKL